MTKKKTDPATEKEPKKKSEPAPEAEPIVEHNKAWRVANGVQKP